MRSLLKFIILSLLLFLPEISFAKTSPKLDSLHILLKETNHDINRIDIQNKIAKSYIRSNADSALFYFDNVLELVDRGLTVGIGDSLLQKRYLAFKSNTLISKGDVNYYLRNGNEALGFYKEAEEFNVTYGRELGLTNCYNRLGMVYKMLGQLDKALGVHQKSLALSKKLGSQSRVGSNMMGMANIYYELGKYDEALDLYRKTLSIQKELGDSIGEALVYVNAGNVLMVKGQRDDATDYYFKALRIYEDKGEKRKLGTIYIHIGNSHYSRKNYVKALEFYNKALEINISIKDRWYQAFSYTNIGNVYYKEKKYNKALSNYLKANQIYEEKVPGKQLAGSYQNLALAYEGLKNYEQALYYAPKAIKLAEKQGVKEIESTSLKSLAGIYLKLAKEEGTKHGASTKLNKAIDVGTRAYNIADEIGAVEGKAMASQIVMEAYAKKGRYSKAYEFAQNHIIANDSLFNKEKENTMADMVAKYESEKKELQIENLNKNNELKASELIKVKEKQRVQKLFLFASLIGLLLILAFSLVLFRLFKQKQKANNELEKQHAQIADQNVIIAKSLSEKEVLLKEIHHRVKNNLQIVSSLLDLQSNTIEDKATLVAISDGQTRMKAMALIHQNLYQNKHIESISFKDYMEQLVVQVSDSNQIEQAFEHSIEMEDVNFDIDTAVPLGLIVNELLTNAFKYAFTKQDIGQLSIKLEHNPEYYELSIKDNGSGLPKDYNFNKSKSLGLKLVRRLSKQLYGKAEYTYDNGSVFTIYFKDTDARREIS